jgi:hypothetical protein
VFALSHILVHSFGNRTCQRQHGRLLCPNIGACRKRLILQNIVESVYQQHGRFLKRDGSGVWVPISKEEAVLKTAMALQYRARKQSSPAARGPPPPTWAVPVAPMPLPRHSTSSAPPLDIFAAHLTLWAISVSLPVPVQRPSMLVLQPIRTPSQCYLPGSLTRKGHPGYWYLQELYNQANQLLLTARFAASNNTQRGSAGFESFSHPQQGAVYSSEGMCDSDSFGHHSANDGPAAQELLCTTQSPSTCAWEPQPSDHHRYNTNNPKTTLSLRTAYFLPQQQQRWHRCRQQAAVRNNKEPVGSRHYGRPAPVNAPPARRR